MEKDSVMAIILELHLLQCLKKTNHFFFQVQFPVFQPAGVEEFPNRQSAGGNPCGEFLRGRVLQRDVARFDVDAVRPQPFGGFDAGAALWIVKKQVFHDVPFFLKYGQI